MDKKYLSPFDIHFLELLPELSAEAISKRRQEAQRTKREKALRRRKEGKAGGQQGKGGTGARAKAPKGKRCATGAANCGGGTVGAGLVPHHGETDGVSLCIQYRREQARGLAGGGGTGSASGSVEGEGQSMVEEFKERVCSGAFDEGEWLEQRAGGEGTSAMMGKRPAQSVGGGAAKRLKKGAPTSKGESGEGGHKDKWGAWQCVTGHVERNEKGWVRVRWRGEPAEQPVVSALDPGRANLFFGAVREAEAADLVDQTVPHWMRTQAQQGMCGTISFQPEQQ